MKDKFEDKDNYKDKKILVLTVGCINYDHDINQFDPIKHLFPKTLRYNYYERFNEIGREKMNAELIELVRAEALDYVVYITHLSQVKRDTLVRIRETGARLIGWFSDDQWRFASFSKKLARYLDFQITTCPMAYRKYLDMNFNPILVPWGANHRVYVRKEGMPKKYDVTFVGQKHGIRGELITELGKRGVGVQCFGRGWNKRVSIEEMIDIFNQSKINLNFSAVGGGHLNQLKARHFEIPMCGGFLLTDYVEGLERFFNIGSEIICFNDIEDAAEKINYYLANDEERERVAESGYRTSIGNHTSDNTLKVVFDEIFRREKASFNPPVPGMMEKIVNRIFRI